MARQKTPSSSTQSGTSKSKSKYRERVAFHEAGHAVIQLHLGGGVRDVSIVPSDEYEGCVSRTTGREPVDDDYDNPRARRRAERGVMAALAGHAAQEEYTGKRLSLSSFPEDRRAALEHIWWLLGSEDGEMAEAYFRFLQRRTRHLVRLRWRAISAVAVELLKHGRLTGSQVKCAISAAFNAELERRKDEAVARKQST